MNNFDHDFPLPDDAVDAVDAVDLSLAQVFADVRHDLADTLPIEDGLAALTFSDPVPPGATDDVPEFRRVVERIAALPLRERLALRQQLPTAALVQAQAIARWLLQAHHACRLMVTDTPRASELVRGLVLDIENEHDLTLDHTRRTARGREVAPEEVRGLAVNLGRDLDIALRHLHALELERAPDLVVAGAVRRDLRDADQLHLLGAIVKLRVYVHSVDVLVRAVDNVEDADLTQIELGDLHLVGVRWSEFTTRWPPRWEEPVRQASVRIDQDRGLWEIREVPRAHDRRHTQVPT
jgi:hypothetical protein